MGATVNEVYDDYMTTYYNFYGVKKGDTAYDLLLNGNICITLAKAFGVEDLSTADLQKSCVDYLKRIGLSDEEVNGLKNRLSKEPAVVKPSKNSKIIKKLNNSGLDSKYSYGGNAYVKSIDESSIEVEYDHQMPLIGADTFIFTYTYDGKKLKKKNKNSMTKTPERKARATTLNGCFSMDESI